MNYDDYEITVDSDLAYQLEMITQAIDEVFGPDYAKANPLLVAALMQNVAIYALAEAIKRRQDH